MDTKHPKNMLAEQQSSMETARKYVMQFAIFFDAMAKHLGLTSNDMKCLTLLSCYGPMTPGQLAKEAGLSPGGITRVIDHLEGRNFIRREHNLKDRRKQLLVPMPSTAKHSHGQRSVDLHTVMASVADRYTEAELALVLDFMHHGTEAVRDLTQKLREADTMRST